ncbi:MAG TPA: pyridoxal-phosphate dependent enzyme [Gemmatimonadaceae bacterium]
MSELVAPTIEQVRGAHERIKSRVLRSPLNPVHAGGLSWLKLENLQPIGSFKLRGATNKMLSVPREALADGVYTASAGNMAQGVAFAARFLKIPATALVPDTAPKAKTDAVERLGAKVERVPYDEWWQVMQSGGRVGARGLFIHPFADTDVMAGNGTIALEILEDRPDAEAVLVPWGGGGLTCGIAAAMRALKPSVRVYAVEVEGAAPFTASRAAGKPVTIDNKRSFIDGMGGRGVFHAIWPLAQTLVADVLTVTVKQVAEAVALLAQRGRVVAEGAGAAPVAAAIAHEGKLAPNKGAVVCVVSGGNIDMSALSEILAGRVPL